MIAPEVNDNGGLMSFVKAFLRSFAVKPEGYDITGLTA